MQDHILIQLAYKYVRNYVQQHDRFTVEDTDHHLITYEAAKEIIRHCPLSKDQELVLFLACSFLSHRFPQNLSSFLKDRLLATEQFQQVYFVNVLLMDQVRTCMKNSYAESPITTVDKILSDARNYHLSSYNLLRTLDPELKKQKSAQWNEHKWEWLDEVNRKLPIHRFHTTYAKRYFTPGIKRNVQRLHELNLLHE